MVVLHYTAMETAQNAIDRLCDPSVEVSAHYVISETGQISLLVPEDMRAWHAGAGRWGDVTDVNSHSIGIELANAGSLTGMPPFPAPQMDALTALLPQILDRWSITPDRVIGHSDMAPDRKADPGPKFDWQRLATLNLSIWPKIAPSPVDMGTFQSNARTFGYHAPETDTGWDDVLNALRLRFRPMACGPLDEIDMGIIHALAQSWPCANVNNPDT